jgi:hypothetical protein
VMLRVTNTENEIAGRLWLSRSGELAFIRRRIVSQAPRSVMSASAASTRGRGAHASTF